MFAVIVAARGAPLRHWRGGCREHRESISHRSASEIPYRAHAGKASRVDKNGGYTELGRAMGQLYDEQPHHMT